MSIVDENNIGAGKIRDLFEHHEIALLMLDFSLLFLVKLSFLIFIDSFLDSSNKSRNNCCKSRNCMGSNTENTQWTNVHNWQNEENISKAKTFEFAKLKKVKLYGKQYRHWIITKINKYTKIYFAFWVHQYCFRRLCVYSCIWQRNHCFSVWHITWVLPLDRYRIR